MARLVAILVVLHAATALAQENTESTYLAQQRYDEGLRAYEAGDGERALEQFRASFAIVRSPNTRLMVARCLRNLERFAEALIEYEITGREAADRARSDPRFEATRAAAETEGASVRGRVGHVRVSIVDPPEGIAIEIAGRTVPVEALELPIPVDTGEATIRASAPGHRSVERTVSVATGETSEVTLALVPEPDAVSAANEEAVAPIARSSGPGEAIAWVGTGLFVASAATAIALVVAAQSRYDGLEQACGGGPCDPSFEDDIAEGRAFEIGAYVAIGVASAAAILAIVGFVMQATEGSGRQARFDGVVRW